MPNAQSTQKIESMPNARQGSQKVVNSFFGKAMGIWLPKTCLF
jgi:hypothetical protein